MVLGVLHAIGTERSDIEFETYGEEMVSGVLHAIGTECRDLLALRKQREISTST